MRAFRGEPSVYGDAQPAKRQAELKIEGLTLIFGGLMALNNVDLDVRNGEFLSIVGPNGAGKTSLLNSITGFYRPQKGRIIFNGEDIKGLRPHEVTKRGIGRTFQNIELFPGMSVLANIFLARHLYCNYRLAPASLFLPSIQKEEVRHRKIVEEIIDFLEMQPIRKRLVGSLPYGIRKRVELGRALALEPKLLILDEPFAGMTLEEKEEMVRFLREINRRWMQTTILVEHDMAVVMSISERIVVFNFGEKIAEGPPEVIKNHPEVIKAYLGEEA
ncbi:MAG TPA: ABC transporter ATP-binding protein [Deltaproteobacteria bacterium]|nr:ABC transporter ATP-binding protein [Deltaproteobacteria bacterium]